METFFIKRGDTRPALAHTLKNSAGVVVDLTDATVALFMAPAGAPGRPLKIDGAPATLGSDPTTGQVAYEWQAADTDTVGNYIAEFQATFTDNGVQTSPPSGFLRVVITQDLGDVA